MSITKKHIFSKAFPVTPCLGKHKGYCETQWIALNLLKIRHILIYLKIVTKAFTKKLFFPRMVLYIVPKKNIRSEKKLLFSDRGYFDRSKWGVQPVELPLDRILMQYFKNSSSPLLAHVWESPKWILTCTHLQHESLGTF